MRGFAEGDLQSIESGFNTSTQKNGIMSLNRSTQRGAKALRVVPLMVLQFVLLLLLGPTSGRATSTRDELGSAVFDNHTSSESSRSGAHRRHLLADYAPITFPSYTTGQVRAVPGLKWRPATSPFSCPAMFFWSPLQSREGGDRSPCHLGPLSQVVQVYGPSVGTADFTFEARVMRTGTGLGEAKYGFIFGASSPSRGDSAEWDVADLTDQVRAATAQRTRLLPRKCRDARRSSLV